MGGVNRDFSVVIFFTVEEFEYKEYKYFKFLGLASIESISNSISIF